MTSMYVCMYVCMYVYSNNTQWLTLLIIGFRGHINIFGYSIGYIYLIAFAVFEFYEEHQMQLFKQSL